MSTPIAATTKTFRYNAGTSGAPVATKGATACVAGRGYWSDTAVAPRCKKRHYFRVRRFQANGTSEWTYICIMTNKKEVVSMSEVRR